MGYTVEWEADDLRCKSEEDARRTAEIINPDEWMSPYHLVVAPWQPPQPELQWALSIEHFQGDHWHDDQARKVWLRIAPHMADGATIEFQGEDFERWRIHWQEGRVFEEYVAEVVWATDEEITAPEGEEKQS